MKCKILSLLVVFSALCVLTAAAQDASPAWSFHVYTGMGLLGPGTDRTNDLSTQNAYVNAKPGYGNGIQIAGGVDRQLTKIISIGLDADYVTGSGSYSHDFTTSNQSVKTMENHKFLSVIPHATFRLLSMPGYELYNTLGFIAAFSPQSNNTANFMATGNGVTTVFVSNYKFGTEVGAKDGIGCRIPVANGIHAFGEVFGYFLGSRPSSLFQQVRPGTSSTTYNYIFAKSGAFNYTETTQVSGTTVTTVNNYNGWPSPGGYFIYSLGINAGISIDIK